MTFETEVLNRLVRLESKVVRGFEEMGIDTDANPNWLSVDDASRVIYVSTIARSFKLMHSVAIAKGASQFGKEYDIVHKGDVIGTMTL